ncbi:MAG: hypothetical protein ACT4OY_01765 [Alphaproteobacteria bacterium]
MKLIKTLALSTILALVVGTETACNTDTNKNPRNKAVVTRPTPNPDALKGLVPEPIKVSWTDVIELQIQDPELKTGVERFLNVLESNAFPYDEAAPEDHSKITRKNFSPQEEIFARLATAKKLYDETGLSDTFIKMGMMSSQKKFVIRQHDRLFDGKAENGANTLNVQMPGKTKFPAMVEMGSDYLKGAQYTGADGRKYPVSLEGVIANELFHLAYGMEDRSGLGISDEAYSNRIESIIVTALGGAQRNESSLIDFTRNSNGGYVILIPPKQNSALTPSPPTNK